MSTITTERTYLRLIDRETGERIFIDKSSNGDADFCGEYSYSLSRFGEREASFETADQVVRVLSLNTPWYNSDETCPSWGYVKPESLAVERVHEVTSITTEPLDLKSLPHQESRGFFVLDIPRRKEFRDIDRKTHMLTLSSDIGVFDPKDWVGREFYLGDRKVKGVSTLIYNDHPTLLTYTGGRLY